MLEASSSGGEVQGRYEALVSERDAVLRRGRQAAQLTVPHLLLPEGFNSTSDLPTPYQSIGARGVRNLASKLLITQFPPNQPNFRYDIDDYTIDMINQETGGEGTGEIEKALAKRERAVAKEFDKAHFRPTAFEAFRQLLVTGNVLLNVPMDGDARAYRLDQYVVKRDWSGTVIEIILKQSFSAISLPEFVQEMLSADIKQKMSVKGANEKVDIFTRIIRLQDGRYESVEEICGQLVPGSDAIYNEEDLPWLALRLTKIDGESYGRGYVEEYMGDLMSLEGLSQALVEGSAASARVLILVNPNGMTNQNDVATANNGDVITGRADDVVMMQADKRADYQVVAQQIQSLEQRLSFAFLMQSAVQRDAERVTAEEIRYMAQELEDALGGMYSLLAQEFQLPLVRLFERRMEARKGVPKMPEDVVDPKIVTGVDALGRGQDLRALDAFLAGLGQAFGPEVLGRYIKLGEAIKRRGVALGINMDGLVKTDDEIAQEEQQAQLMALAQNLGPDALKVAGGLAGKEMDGQNMAEAAAMKAEQQGAR